MDNAALRRRDGTVIEKESVDAFRKAFRGEGLLWGDAGYDAARTIWNAAIDKHPGMIARCRTQADVVLAVQFARANDILVAVKGGGHNVAGRALCDDGIVIDLSPMNAVSVEPASRTVQVEGGALLADLDRATHVYGLAVPAGVVSKTGVGGLTLGGGAGWLSRKYGLTCDNLISCNVVTAMGETLIANAATNPDLYWGLRGGGGNFGIVTSFLFQAHPVSTVLGGLVLYSRDQAVPLLRHFRQVMETAPDDLTVVALLAATPDGAPVAGIAACWCGDLEEGTRVLAPLREFGTPFLDAIAPMPFPAMQMLADESSPDRVHNYWKGSSLEVLSDPAIEALVDSANGAGSPLTHIAVARNGGAMARVAPDQTAFALRGAKYTVMIEASWADAGESAQHIAWTQKAYEALRPHATNSVGFNFLGEEGSDAVRRAVGDNYQRLVALKTKYDPTNFFSLNQNIEPRR
jgi:FAD/FMN-containing dehydrogenase